MTYASAFAELNEASRSSAPFDGFLPVTEAALRKRGARLLFHDTFERDCAGWNQLIDGFVPQNVPTLTNYPANKGKGLLLRTSDATLSSRGGKATAIKRLSRPKPGVIDIIFEFMFAWGGRYGEQQTRGFEFGCDTADKDGVRSYPRLRWMNYNDSVSAEFPNIGFDRGWYVSTGTSNTPVYQQLKSGPGGTTGSPIVTRLGYNENKNDQDRAAMHIQLDTTAGAAGHGFWRGINVGHVGYGSLADDPAPWAIPFSNESLPIFSYGFNAAATLFNLVSGSKTSSTLAITEARGVLL